MNGSVWGLTMNPTTTLFRDGTVDGQYSSQRCFEFRFEALNTTIFVSGKTDSMLLFIKRLLAATILSQQTSDVGLTMCGVIRYVTALRPITCLP